jgi:hypothetical protein
VAWDHLTIVQINRGDSLLSRRYLLEDKETTDKSAFEKFELTTIDHGIVANLWAKEENTIKNNNFLTMSNLFGIKDYSNVTLNKEVKLKPILAASLTGYIHGEFVTEEETLLRNQIRQMDSNSNSKKYNNTNQLPDVNRNEKEILANIDNQAFKRPDFFDTEGSKNLPFATVKSNKMYSSHIDRDIFKGFPGAIERYGICIAFFIQRI